MFLPEIYGLEDHIPFGRIRTCTPINRWYGNTVRLDFSRENGPDGALSLRLRKQSEFLGLLDKFCDGPLTNAWSGRDTQA